MSFISSTTTTNPINSSSYVFKDWNDTFLESSNILVEKLDSFKHSNFQDKIKLLQEIKFDIEKNHFDQDISKLSLETKENFFKDEYVIKKRPGDHIFESHCWEIAILFSSDYVTPSYPLKIGNNTVIVQPMEQVKVADRTMKNLPKESSTVSLKNYFLSHIFSFLVGAQDLSGKNIGITPEGNIRFFDNEDVFNFGALQKSELSFFAPFLSTAFDWNQYRQPIDADLAKDITNYINELNHKKMDLEKYAKIRNLPNEITFGILSKMDTLNGFKFEKGTTFRDFFIYLYPKLSNLDGLKKQVKDILVSHDYIDESVVVDDGVALFYTTKAIRYLEPNTEEQKKGLERAIGDLKLI